MSEEKVFDLKAMKEAYMKNDNHTLCENIESIRETAIKGGKTAREVYLSLINATLDAKTDYNTNTDDKDVYDVINMFKERSEKYIKSMNEKIEMPNLEDI